MISVKQKSPSEDVALTDLTPLLDIIFLNLFFLILTLSVSQHALQLHLPITKNQNNLVEENPPVLYLQKNGIYSFKKRSFSSFDSLKETLLNEKDDLKALSIAGERDIPFQKFVDVLDFLKNINIQDINILIEPSTFSQ